MRCCKTIANDLYYHILLSRLYYYVEHISNIYMHAMCTRLCERVWSLMHHGLTSMASVNSGISGGIPCNISDCHPLHKI